MSNIDLTLFKDDVKNICSAEFVSSAEDSLIFDIKLDSDSNDEVSNVMDQLSEELSQELFGRSYERNVEDDLKNPCPEGTTFVDYRQGFLKINENVYKKVVKQGTGPDIDLERSKVSYEYAMFTESSVDPFDSNVLSKKLGFVSRADGVESLLGCFLALASMKLNEESYFLLSSCVMFGKLGCVPRVEPNADILFYAKVVKVENTTEMENKDADDVKTPFKKFMKEVVKQYKNAKETFVKKDFISTIIIYRKWIEKIENYRVSNDEDEARKKEFLIKMYLNVSLCYNKIKKPQKTCLMLRELERLTSIENNPKALFAKGKALMMLDDFKRARKYFNMAFEILPNEKAIASTLKELGKREQALLDFKADRVKLQQKLQEEEQRKEEFEQQAFQEQRKREEALQIDLKAFKGKLIKTIEEFKNDPSLEFINLLMKLPTAEHICLANHVCEQHGIHLKGTQKSDSDEFDYYLKKHK